MCIENSVGEGGVNNRGDAVILQVLLVMNGIPTGVDGNIGPNTKEAIRQFQSQVMQAASPDGRVDPGGATLARLRQGIPPGPLNALKLHGIMPDATDARIQTYLSPLLAGMAQRNIDTPLRQAHFLAQLGHESGGLRFAEELADGTQYENRADLGNNQPGDGPRFKGRGLIQLTGRTNYSAYGQAIARDLLSNPSVVATNPDLAVDVACWYWETRKLNPPADADDVEAVTRKVNGGLNGLEDRKGYLRRGKFFLGL